MNQNIIHLLAVGLRSDNETAKRLCGSLTVFMQSVELLFDHDWEYTTDSLHSLPPDDVIDPTGTFLHPNVGDESNNWANRGLFLAHYRKLVTVMREIGLYEPEEF